MLPQSDSLATQPRQPARGTLAGRPVTWAVAEEMPVALVINGHSHAVMMATPADFEDFGIGFLLAEGLVADAAAVQQVWAEEMANGIVLYLMVTPAALAPGRVGQGRATGGWSGCGLCGVGSLEEAMRPLRRVMPQEGLREEAVLAAFDALPAHQPLNTATHSVHAAAWCDLDGRVLLVREDVGRHNALDKLIGARARGPLSTDPGFVAMSSRCSFELVQKALALRLAGEAGMTVMALNRSGGVVTFAASPATSADTRMSRA
jgi:FdhD protein